MKVSVPMYATGPLANALAHCGVTSIDMTLDVKAQEWVLVFLTPLADTEALKKTLLKIGGTILGGDDEKR